MTTGGGLASRSRVARVLGGAALLLSASPSRPGDPAHVAGRGTDALLVPAHAIHGPPLEPSRRADAALRRGRSVRLARDVVLLIPPAFESHDGAYDLLVQLHGVLPVVRRNVEASGVNAIALVVNSGRSSRAYERRFSDAAALHALLARVDAALGRAGLVAPRRRRVALSAFSAGYAALLRPLRDAAFAEGIDAVLLEDALHCGYASGGHLDARKLEPLLAFARRAARGERLLVVSHSAIDPPGYAGTAETALLLARAAAHGGVEIQRLDATWDGALPAPSASRGVLILAFPGATSREHARHLQRMGDTVLAPLRSRWEQGR